MERKRPRSREKFVTEKKGGVFKRGEGTGNGPAGSGGFFEQLIQNLPDNENQEKDEEKSEEEKSTETPVDTSAADVGSFQ